MELPKKKMTKVVVRCGFSFLVCEQTIATKPDIVEIGCEHGKAEMHLLGHLMKLFTKTCYDDAHAWNYLFTQCTKKIRQQR